MARPLPILGGILLSFSPPAEATAQYSIIPEPSRTELRQETAKTLQLLSDQEVPTLGTDAYRLTVTPQGAHLASGGREGRIYGLATLRQLRDQLAGQPEGIPCGVITDKPRYP
ncbi:MAG: glycoside hydrolase family 20 zincin-like fold domain-containing protein [Akkermansia sp.]|nr:glycoside hydrolase family 20 zincin-like fold domain-containing protein [Akkermansia sp.]